MGLGRAYLSNTRYQFIRGSENRKGFNCSNHGVATVVPYPTSRRQ